MNSRTKQLTTDVRESLRTIPVGPRVLVVFALFVVILGYMLWYLARTGALFLGLYGIGMIISEVMT